MMDKKPVSALWIIALIFSLMGILFMISGTATWYFVGETEAWMVGPIHLLIGCVFLIIGMSFCIAVGIRRRKAKRLVDNGRYIWGEIVGVEPNTMIRINNRYPYYALVRFTNPYGKVITFRSTSSMALRNRDDIAGRHVKVYIADETYKEYHVDIEPLL